MLTHTLPMTQEQGVYLSILIVATILIVNILNGLVIYFKVSKDNQHLRCQNEDLKKRIMSLEEKYEHKH